MIDNCEHVVDAAADAMRALLEATVNVRVLATTREALRLKSEVLYAVEPLSLPRLGATRRAEVLAAPAVTLFAGPRREERGRVSSGKSADLDLVLREITRMSEGVPLAIELAAAGLASSGLGDLARQLTVDVGTLVDHRQMFSAVGHRSLQSALDWTHSSASHEEQVVFRRASFARFQAEDGAAVAGKPNERTGLLRVCGR